MPRHPRNRARIRNGGMARDPHLPRLEPGEVRLVIGGQGRNPRPPVVPLPVPRAIPPAPARALRPPNPLDDDGNEIVQIEAPPRKSQKGKPIRVN